MRQLEAAVAALDQTADLNRQLPTDHGTSTPFPNCRTYGSGNGVDLVTPSMDHRVAVEVVNKLDDALLQLVL
jgi:hypothetical protein